jgi:hypothetical protein
VDFQACLCLPTQLRPDLLTTNGRYVNHSAFNAAWTKYKTGQSSDRLALATACVILSVATYYLPSGHPLHGMLAQPQSSDEEAGQRYYYLGMTVLDRHLAENRKYSLELIELHLVRCHYLMLSKKDGEAIWALKGDLVTMGTAMGLHRDPGRWKMSLEAAERRRWAWSNLVYLDRFVDGSLLVCDIDAELLQAAVLALWQTDIGLAAPF